MYQVQVLIIIGCDDYFALILKLLQENSNIDMKNLFTSVFNVAFIIFYNIHK